MACSIDCIPNNNLKKYNKLYKSLVLAFITLHYLEICGTRDLQ